MDWIGDFSQGTITACSTSGQIVFLSNKFSLLSYSGSETQLWDSSTLFVLGIISKHSCERLTIAWFNMASIVVSGATSNEDVLLQQDVLLEIESEERKGWITKFTNEEDLQRPTRKLHDALESFEESLSLNELHDVRHTEQQCLEDFEKVITEMAAREDKKGKRKEWIQKLCRRSERFCLIALHYQEVFNALNNQAPQYTSVIWAAVRFLLVYNTNNEKLKASVADTLDKIGRDLEQLEVISTLQPVRQIVTGVTDTYKHLMGFLAEALSYYKESRVTRFRKNLTQPWEQRFQHSVNTIEQDVQRVRHVAQICLLSLAQKMKEGISLQIQDMEQKIDHSSVVLQQVLSDTGLLVKEGIEIQNMMKEAQSLISVPVNQFAALDIWKPAIKSILINENGRPNQTRWMMTSATALPKLASLEQSCKERLLRYRLSERKLSPPLMNIQCNIVKKGEMFQWLRCKKSSLLWIQGRRLLGPLDWTTIISLEVSALAQDIPNTTVLECYCYEFSRKTDTTVQTMLQLFIVQLVAQHAGRFTSNLSHQHTLSICRLAAAESNMLSLWSMFASCLEIASPKHLYMFIDNIDNLILPERAEGGLSDAEILLELLDGLAKTSTPICKILVTSRLDNQESIVSKLTTIRRQFHQSRCYFLQVPHFPEKLATQIQPPRRVVRYDSQVKRVNTDECEEICKRMDSDLTNPVEDLIMKTSAGKRESTDEDDLLDNSDDFDDASSIDSPSTFINTLSEPSDRRINRKIPRLEDSGDQEEFTGSAYRANDSLGRALDFCSSDDDLDEVDDSGPSDDGLSFMGNKNPGSESHNIDAIASVRPMEFETATSSDDSE
ncbi:hypothetical protein BT63DRAFT_472150 [Microthyrium microscopicum]|uniref:NACHT domain-containing protein n=1 Tax=Microthyrium microscopicum TaxID=703497 RepID=A0A6A6U731_9PEZI|nr:hypothetical protein BT63DRAFT_472150 [Microthyrium microscopicum]